MLMPTDHDAAVGNILADHAVRSPKSTSPRPRVFRLPMGVVRRASHQQHGVRSPSGARPFFAMNSPYRSDVEVFRERKRDLERELEGLRQERAALARLAERERAIERELARIVRILELGPIRTTLDRVDVASP